MNILDVISISMLFAFGIAFIIILLFWISNDSEGGDNK